MNTIVFVLACVLVVFSGCVARPSVDSLVLAEGKSLTKLQMIDGESFETKMSRRGIPGLDEMKEAQIRDECKAAEGEGGRAFAPLAFLVGPAIDFVLEQVDKALQAELQKYVAVYSAKVEEKFYKSMDPSGPSAAWTCFRFSRAVGQAESPHIVFDFVGQFELTDDRDAVRIRPLRLFLLEPKAKGEHVGITLSMTAESVWRDQNRGRSEKIFDSTLVSERVDLENGGPFVKYYLDTDWTDSPRLPLIPWSTNAGVGKKSGDVTLMLTVAEVSAPPQWLKYAATVFTKNKGDVAKMLKDAAGKLLSEQKGK